MQHLEAKIEGPKPALPITSWVLHFQSSLLFRWESRFVWSSAISNSFLGGVNCVWFILGLPKIHNHLPFAVLSLSPVLLTIVYPVYTVIPNKTQARKSIYFATQISAYLDFGGLKWSILTLLLCKVNPNINMSPSGPLSWQNSTNHGIPAHVCETL